MVLGEFKFRTSETQIFDFLQVTYIKYSYIKHWTHEDISLLQKMCLKYRFKETFNIAKLLESKVSVSHLQPSWYQMAGYETVQNVVNLIAVQPAAGWENGQLGSCRGAHAVS